MDFTELGPTIPEEGDPISRAAMALFTSRRTVVLTGSGISADSGIPTFRHQSALWKKYDPEIYCSISGFANHPEKVWEMCQSMNLKDAVPNEAHYALAKMEKMGKIKCLLTQNIDNLHQQAGNKQVIEFHGNSRETFCLQCKDVQFLKDVHDIKELPPKCKLCGASLKPNFTLFGESIPPEALKKAEEEVTLCDILLVIGTSASVIPASQLPLQAKKNGSKIIEINLESTPLTGTVTDLFLQGNAVDICKKIVDEMKKLKKKGH